MGLREVVPPLHWGVGRVLHTSGGTRRMTYLSHLFPGCGRRIATKQTDAARVKDSQSDIKRLCSMSTRQVLLGCTEITIVPNTSHNSHIFPTMHNRVTVADRVADFVLQDPFANLGPTKLMLRNVPEINRASERRLAHFPMRTKVNHQ